MTYTSNAYQLLINIGKVNYRETWLNYLDLGITKSDIPALQKLVADKKLHSSSPDFKEIWISLHAWRALGQLKSEKSIKLLLMLNNNLFSDDDLALEEIPIVLGMIASDNLDVLREFSHDSANDEFARVIAAEGMKYVAEQHPEKREACVALLAGYLENLNQGVSSLNSLIVGMLIDLNAKNSIDSIRKAYNANLIDITQMGDLEDVEIELGLQLEHETNNQLYDKTDIQQTLIREKDITSSDDIYELIESFLQDYGNDESILDAAELDGFFTAIISAQNIILPSQWMPAIWGGEANSPDWESMETLQLFTNAVMGYYNFIADCLLENDYEPLFMERKVGDKVYIIVDNWCEGYIRGSDLWPPLSTTDAGKVLDALESIRMFSTKKGFEQLKTMNETEIEFWQQQVSLSATKIYQHFLQQRLQQQEPVRVNKVGRNDLCSCGSGKKYKKCCLH